MSRILLNRKDLLALQHLEWSIFEVVVRKTTKIHAMVLQQLNKILLYTKNKNIAGIEDK